MTVSQPKRAARWALRRSPGYAALLGGRVQLLAPRYYRVDHDAGGIALTFGRRWQRFALGVTWRPRILSVYLVFVAVELSGPSA